jgi:hypothetical protein
LVATQTAKIEDMGRELRRAEASYGQLRERALVFKSDAAFAAASTSDPATWRAQWRQMLEVDSTSDKLIVSMGWIGHTRRARPPPPAGAPLSVEAGRFYQLRLFRVLVTMHTQPATLCVCAASAEHATPCRNRCKCTSCCA